ncbi:hypothetical protein [Pseudooceanicola sp.]|uniref:hypothetical protein n=1 Tax=Pseudooceanicola sp. TaxID=1914328 RepID=UPI004059A9FB
MTEQVTFMRKITLGLAAAAGLAACSPQVPDSGAGVGFSDYDSYVAEREAALQGQTAAALPPASAVSAETLDGAPVSTGSDSPSDIAAETQAALRASAQNSGVAPLQASPSNPAPEAVDSFGISRENDFSAVDAQRTIQDDKQRLAAVRAQYEQVQPTALPSRSGSGPNIVAYALQTTNQPGEQLYSRGALSSASRSARNCAQYPSPDLAQTDFLKSGGPERDRKGLDPDGDGFACSWDPRPFRAARGG